MKNLNDLISQIEDERILSILHELKEKGIMYLGHNVGLFDIKEAPALIKSWQEDYIPFYLKEYELTGDIWHKTEATDTERAIEEVKKIMDTAYLFALKNGHIVFSVNSPERALTFFGGEG